MILSAEQEDEREGDVGRKLPSNRGPPGHELFTGWNGQMGEAIRGHGGYLGDLGAPTDSNCALSLK